MRIIIYDDDNNLIDFVGNVTKKYSKDNKEIVWVKLASNDYKKIIRESYKCSSYCFEPDLYLISTSVKRKHDGIDLADMIRKVDPLSYIVFLSNDDDCRDKIPYSIRFFDMFYKPIGTTEFIRLLDQIIKDFSVIFNVVCKSGRKTITITNRYQHVQISLDDIVALEHNKPKTIIYTRDGEECAVYHSLKDLEDKIEEATSNSYNTFVKTHKSFVVNLLNIKAINPAESYVATVIGKDIPISRLRKKEVKEQLDHYNNDLKVLA